MAPLSELIDYGLRSQQRRGGQTARFHLTLYTAPPEADPWAFAGPGSWPTRRWATFRSLPDVKRLSLQAQRMPAFEMSFRNLILNQRCDTTAPFLNMALWEAGGDNVYDIRNLKGLLCYAGLDLGATGALPRWFWYSPITTVGLTRCRSVGCRARRCRSAPTRTACRTGQWAQRRATC